MATQDAAIIETAHATADAARRAILPYFRRADLATENKDASGFDPVTEADRAAEQAMRAVLQQRRPGDGIIGEEFGNTPGQSGITWVLDPIDGTRGFMSGTPTWGVLVAAARDGVPIFGIVDQPYIGERFWGGFGQAAMHGPMGARDLAVRGDRPLDQSVLFTTFPELGTTREAAAFAEVARLVKLTRYGMDCYAYALLAAGQIDLVIEAGLSNYDIQAPMAVIEAAGGIVTNWQGGPAHQGGRVIAAAGRQQHDAALAILSRAP
ncbi:histidinol-phosphatase [Lutimaribacter sp. EGI FJ00015]|uniref:Histidinol-phosphatase n=1 Tax=Lutimaribacter degradans TaxID=2945989 RepID=A0ACC5ZZC4_9RHOB|nr:histidinol-phosphatase [Lutimaribacter sp. EGI FJ00013]MCM2562709.1 histidinol-phosphatase [Lutimaribacter sp. EGI FJ00013]MCO0613866.1 histidinol-phosphatase [Lutimaribacter sp. EGI FJ00015]MCO0636651.1 histidinol-phosphatase [Lutimaribacter sp. EGI FJ00014]